ncbi:hypothetical protein Dimus_038382 [Dionaea muscipula]
MSPSVSLLSVVESSFAPCVTAWTSSGLKEKSVTILLLRSLLKIANETRHGRDTGITVVTFIQHHRRDMVITGMFCFSAY